MFSAWVNEYRKERRNSKNSKPVNGNQLLIQVGKINYRISAGVEGWVIGVIESIRVSFNFGSEGDA